jgi:putative permease
VVITIALLVFGELWGIWGLIFAIPLATLIQAVVVALVASVSGKAAAPREP